jgi:hypothetical protein
MTDSSSPDDETGQDLVPAAPPPAPVHIGPAGAAALPDDDPEEPDLDAHGFDPAAYEWVPVLRKPRRDGFTPQRQLDFIRALADTGCVEMAAHEVGMSPKSCYRLRNSPEGAQFAAAWDAALPYAARRLVDIAFDRAIHGSDEPVFDKAGQRVGRRMRQNDRLLMFLLRGFMPERFRYAHRDLRQADEPPPVELPLDQALAQLLPVAPPEPHALMAPDELEVALQCADILDGKLPHWHRGRGDAEPPEAVPLGPEFERQLENAKRAAAGVPPLGEDASWNGEYWTDGAEGADDDAFLA